MSDNRQSLSDLGAIAGDQEQAQQPAAADAAAADTAVEAPAPVVAQPVTPLREQEIDKQGRAYATGRRKDAVARVWLKPGSGKIVINGRDQEVYFARPTLRLVINQPFDVRSEEHTSELQSLMRLSYAVFCLKKIRTTDNTINSTSQ